MIRAQIRCIRKWERNNPHERITHVGGVNPNGQRWKLAQEEAIAGIENRTYQFFVNVNFREVDVIVATHQGRKYLKTVADGYAPNNLLNLPECP
jgi:hypothetical protein